ncbi:MAG: fused MFS/spermidine synthase [Chloroflexi bacterium]|nr:fused MFS/spermidine synthase [Chloroflexota bacterium]
MEYVAPELIQAMGLRRVIYSGRTQYQEVSLLETGPFGRTLVLDGKTQSAEVDEFVYHEGLVQPAMVAHPSPRRVFIAGGGEGATAREVLRHTTVSQLVMVDLDGEVVALCREHLWNHHQGAFDDPRLQLLHQDALAYLRDTPEQFDVMIIDISDPLEGGPAYKLYTQEFYRLVTSRLAPGGLMVVQSGPAGPTNYGETFTAIRNTVASIFPQAFSYRTFVHSFGTNWGFVIGGLADARDVFNLSADEIDTSIAARVSTPLRYYDGIAHQGMFGLPKYLRQALAAEDRVITDANPIFAV